MFVAHSFREQSVCGALGVGRRKHLFVRPSLGDWTGLDLDCLFVYQKRMHTSVLCVCVSIDRIIFVVTDSVCLSVCPSLDQTGPDFFKLFVRLSIPQSHVHFVFACIFRFAVCTSVHMLLHSHGLHEQGAHWREYGTRV